jgi:hypothetical protein
VRFTIGCTFCGCGMVPDGDQESFGEKVVRCRRWSLRCPSCGTRERVTVTLTEVRSNRYADFPAMEVAS